MSKIQASDERKVSDATAYLLASSPNQGPSFQNITETPNSQQIFAFGLLFGNFDNVLKSEI
jgi:hypothetical protein